MTAINNWLVAGMFACYDVRVLQESNLGADDSGELLHQRVTAPASQVEGFCG